VSRLLILGLVLIVLAALAAWASVRSFREREWMRTGRRSVLTLICVLAGALAVVVNVSMRGYEALTEEALVATIECRPAGNGRFQASVKWPDGTSDDYVLAGDALYVDARIVKWHPWVNIVGLHTSYRMDRIGGRYDDLAQEQQGPRTIHALSSPGWLDAFDLVKGVGRSLFLVDAEYGSATFAPADRPEKYELRVTTSGLLLRES
jgi:hypothetical protein